MKTKSHFPNNLENLEVVDYEHCLHEKNCSSLKLCRWGDEYKYSIREKKAMMFPDHIIIAHNWNSISY